MWFALALLLSFPLLALIFSLVVIFLRLKNRNQLFDFMVLKTREFKVIYLFFLALLIFSLPLWSDWREARHIRHHLQRKPFVLVMRNFHPDLYKELRRNVEKEGIKSSELHLFSALSKMYERWLRSLPYAEDEAIMRFLRLRYSQTDFLSQVADDDYCKFMNLPRQISEFGEKHLNYFKTKISYLEESMSFIFADIDYTRVLSYPDRRWAMLETNKIMDKLNQQFKVEIPKTFPDNYGCEYQKNFYSELLNYSDSEISKILRWIFLREIEQFDRDKSEREKMSES